MISKLSILSQTPMLAGLGNEQIQALAEKSDLITVTKGDVVVRENDPGDALYVVVTGRLQAGARLPSGSDRVFASYTSGDCFGEMPLLSGETHWADVRALNDSVLLAIPRQAFDEVLKQDPRMAVGFTRRLGRRIKELREEKQRAQASTIFSLYSAIPGIGRTLLAVNFAASLAHETRAPVLLLDLTGKHSGKPLAKCDRLDLEADDGLGGLIRHDPAGFDQLRLGLDGADNEVERMAPLLANMVKRYDYALVDLPHSLSPSVTACLRQSDRIFILSQPDNAQLDKTRLLTEELRASGAGHAPQTQVILTGVTDTGEMFMEQVQSRLGEPVGCWLRWIPESDMPEGADTTPYVLRKPMAPYSICVRRLARELGHTLVGLALGAGGARGLAHIGVIRVLEQENISVDMVAGSSMGALVGAAWAIGKSADEMEQIAYRVKSRRAFLKLLDPMFPGAGIVRGMRVVHFLRSIVGDLSFAETIIPVRIVATDLTHNTEVVFDDGKLLDAIRASISIPGVFRPIQDNGSLLVDGGIAGPVPVDVLAQAGAAKIIAVNTVPKLNESSGRSRYHSEMLRMRRHRTRAPLQEAGPVIETPTTIIDVYMRSMHAMQSQIAEEACLNADVVLRPVLAGGVWYDFYQPEKYIRCGEAAARQSLDQLKELIRV